MTAHGKAMFDLGLAVAGLEEALSQTDNQRATFAAANSMVEMSRQLEEILASVPGAATKRSRLAEHAEELAGLVPRLRGDLDKWLTEARKFLEGALPAADHFGLTVSATLIRALLARRSPTPEEVELVEKAIVAELKRTLFVFVSSERAGYYENEAILSASAALKFPSCYRELMESGNCYAFGLSTAAVFHAMRAAELAARALGQDLGVSFPFPLELAEMHCLLDQMEAKILAKKNLAKSADKDAQLKFYSEAAAQFRYFKDAWRVRVAHAREAFTDTQAQSILDHVRDLLEVLSERLTEPV